VHVQQIGPYVLVGELGRGGAGVIYRARDPGLQRDVAIKLLSGRRSDNPASLARFRQEAEALAKLRHPHVVKVHTAGEHDGLPYLVMDLIEGASLAKRIEEDGPLPVDEALAITLSLARALEHVHGQAILHRDLKPDNVLLNRRGDPLLTDFGLAKDRSSSQDLSREGAVMGTPGYWPPEQATGQLAQIGPTADIYSLGATLYAMLTGVPPAQGKTVRELLVATCDLVPDPPSAYRPDVLPDVDAVCARCLAKAPRDRYPDATSLVAALERAIAGEPLPSERSSGWGLLLAFAVVALAGAGAWLAFPASDPTPSPAPPTSSPPAPPPRDPARLLASSLTALEAGDAIDLDAAAAALAERGPPGGELLERLHALPAGEARDRLLILALLLAGRSADASAVLGPGSTPMHRAVQLCLDCDDMPGSVQDTSMLIGGSEAGLELAKRLGRLLALAERVLNELPGPLGRTSGRRCQATLAHVITRLRVVQPGTYQYLDVPFYERARSLVPDSPEASYVDLTQALVLKDHGTSYPGLHRKLGERMIAMTPTEAWDRLFVFLRGYLLLENGSWPDVPLEVGIDGGEAGLAAVADRLPEINERYSHQLLALLNNLARVHAARATLLFQEGNGALARADTRRAYELAARSLLGPTRQGERVPALEEVDADWLRGLDRLDRGPTCFAAVAFLQAGRLELIPALADLLLSDGNGEIRELLFAEVDLIRGDTARARARLEALTVGQKAIKFRDYWGALAHARHLLGDDAGAESARRSGLPLSAAIGAHWHDPEAVHQLWEHGGWWPGVGPPARDE
jgi:serine/threonine protein kinase